MTQPTSSDTLTPQMGIPQAEMEPAPSPGFPPILEKRN